jgi:hypothetical protein
VADNASPALASIRDRLRRQKSKLRSTLESFLRERETSKYLQEQVVTDRNGRYVLMVRAEHRGSIPGIVHGASASGQSLFLEPLGTVEINNDIVELEKRKPSKCGASCSSSPTPSAAVPTISSGRSTWPPSSTPFRRGRASRKRPAAWSR